MCVCVGIVCVYCMYVCVYMCVCMYVCMYVGRKEMFLFNDALHVAI